MTARRPKVLFSATVTGHLRAFHLPFLAWFRVQGWVVHVVAGDDSPVPHADYQHVISIERSPFCLRNLRAIGQMRELLLRERFTLIHCHTPMGAAITRLAALSCASGQYARLLYTAHGFHFFTGAPWVNWLTYYPVELGLSIATDVLVTINREDSLRAHKFRLSQGPILRIPIGLDATRFPPASPEERREARCLLGLRDEHFVMIYVAELSVRKNQMFLIRRMAEIRRYISQAKLILVGSDSLNGRCRQLVDELKLGDSVEFLGRREDVPTLLAAADLYVSASRQEGLGINLLEAIARGVPVCATKIRGHVDIIRHGENGVLVALDDEQGWDSACIQMFDRPALRNRYAYAALATLGAHTKAVQEPRLLNVYKNLTCGLVENVVVL